MSTDVRYVYDTFLYQVANMTVHDIDLYRVRLDFVFCGPSQLPIYLLSSRTNVKMSPRSYLARIIALLCVTRFGRFWTVPPTRFSLKIE